MGRAAVGQRASLLRMIGGNDASQPKGFRVGAVADLNANLARQYDDTISNALMANFNARQSAASMLTNQQQLSNPLGWSGAVAIGNSSVMNAPLNDPGILGPIMGAVGGIGGGLASGFAKNAKF